MDVTTWLTQQGFAEYIDSFVENEVDEKALATLTAEDLKDLGVRKIGHRRNLMNAIAMLSDANTQSDSPQETATMGAEPDARSGNTYAARQKDQTGSPEAERRHLTVMFVYTVGSTELSTRSRRHSGSTSASV